MARAAGGAVLVAAAGGAAVVWAALPGGETSGSSAASTSGSLGRRTEGGREFMRGIRKRGGGALFINREPAANRPADKLRTARHCRLTIRLFLSLSCLPRGSRPGLSARVSDQPSSPRFVVLPPPDQMAAPATVPVQPSSMQSSLLEEASKIVPDQQKLINIVSKRVRQLSQGHRPLVQVMPRMVYSDIALKELIDGKLTFRDGAVVPEEEA